MIRRPPWWPWEDEPPAELVAVDPAVDALAVLELRVQVADRAIEAALKLGGPVPVDVLLDIRLMLRPDLRVNLRPAAPGPDGSRSP